MFDELEQLQQSDGAAITIERLVESLRAENDYHKLFDALMLKQKFEMGLPLVQPTSFDDVPADQQETFEKVYVDAAREVAGLFLEQDNLPQAWLYLKTIREPESIRAALDAVDMKELEDPERTEELIRIALYEGAHPVKGLEFMLRTHGTCNTITAVDQHAQQMSGEDRRQSAGLLVRELYRDLSHTLRREVEQKGIDESPGESLRELMDNRDWLFEQGNYHIDVSHLNSVVRFARFLDSSDSELSLAMELSEYGSQLAEQFQYPADPPFDDFYPAHRRYFQVLLDEDRDEALAFFRQRLDSAEADDKPLIAYVTVDLLARLGQLDDAREMAGEHLKDIDEGGGLSFAELCRRTGHIDSLRQLARDRGDLVGYTAALLEEQKRPVST